MDEAKLDLDHILLNRIVAVYFVVMYRLNHGIAEGKCDFAHP